MADNFVAILMGSDSDYPLVENTIAVLKGFGIRYEVKVTSAHRTPEVTHAFVTDAEKRGCGVFICAAGLAAHLAGAVAANTTRPVIGIPVDCGPLNGVDALYSTVMMPCLLLRILSRILAQRCGLVTNTSRHGMLQLLMRVSSCSVSMWQVLKTTMT